MNDNNFGVEALELDILNSLESHKMWLNDQETGSRANFVYINFDNFDFTNFDLSHAVFKNCSFKNAIFKYSVIQSVEFKSCDLSFAVFNIKDISLAVFDEVKFNSTQFFYSIFNSCVFKDSSLSDMNFSKSSFISCYFSGLNFKSVEFNSSVLENCQIKNSTFLLNDFAYSDLKNSIFINVIFEGTKMHSLNILHSTFSSTKFQSLHTVNDVYHKTSFRNIIFHECKLDNCQFEDKNEFIKNIVSKNVKIPNIVRLFFILKTMIILCLTSIAYLLFFKSFTAVYLLAIILIVDILMLCKVFTLMQIKKKSISLNIQNFFVFSFVALTVVTFFSAWLGSLEYNNFNFSISILLLFSTCTLNLTSYVKNIIKS